MVPKCCVNGVCHDCAVMIRSVYTREECPCCQKIGELVLSEVVHGEVSKELQRRFLNKIQGDKDVRVERVANQESAIKPQKLDFEFDTGLLSTKPYDGCLFTE